MLHGERKAHSCNKHFQMYDVAPPLFIHSIIYVAIIGIFHWLQPSQIINYRCNIKYSNGWEQKLNYKCLNLIFVPRAKGMDFEEETWQQTLNF